MSVSSPTGAVFLSYAREDAAAARRLAEALRAHGVEVWFDQNELRGGDAWDAKIRKQIRDCALFVPVVSANTQARDEGYFRREWKLAVERTADMAHGKSFLAPVAIDEIAESSAIVPDEFVRIQWLRLPGGLPTPQFVADIKRLLADTARSGRSASTGRTVGPSDGPQHGRADESVAVLAFANMSGDVENEYFSDGISEELLNILAKMPGLRVAARTSAFHFKGKNVPVPEIARILAVDYVVEGSVRKAGNRVRITAQLIKAATGFHLWSHSYDRELRDIFALQDEIARAIAHELQLKLAHPTGRIRAVDPEAHRLVLEGRHFWNQRTAEGFARADMALNKAVAIDPDFAEAHAALAEVCVIRATYRLYEGLEADDDLKRTQREAELALALNPRLAEAHAARGFQLLLERRLAESEEKLLTAIEINPNSALARTWYSVLLASRGRITEAVQSGRVAAELDPLFAMNLQIHAAYLAWAERYGEALKINERVASLRGWSDILNSGIQAVTLLNLGRTAEAAEAARSVLRRPDLRPRWDNDAIAIYTLRRCGCLAEAEAFSQQLFAAWPATCYKRGFVLGAMGRLDEALPFLPRTPTIPSAWLMWDQMWDEHRGDPRLDEVLARLGQAEDNRRAQAERRSWRCGALDSHSGVAGAEGRDEKPRATAGGPNAQHPTFNP